MEKLDSGTIQEIFKFIEAYLNLEIKESQQKIDNLKRIDVNVFYKSDSCRNRHRCG